MNNPCNECVVLAMCKARFNDLHWLGESSIIRFAEMVCPILNKYITVDKDKIDEMRIFYGLKPVMDYHAYKSV